MPTRLLLDGDDLPELMLRIRAEMGPHARVVKAERIRSGGFAGFFAKEHFELTVEVPDHPPLTPRRAGVPGGASGGSGGAGASGGGLEALVAAADAGDDAVESADAERAAPAEPPVSTASDSFAEVLASVRAMVGQGETAGVAVAPAPAEVPPGAALPAPDQQALPAAPAEPVAFAFPRVERPADVDADVESVAGSEAGPDADARPEPHAPTGPRPSTAPPADGAGAERSNAATAADLLELGVPVRLLEGFENLTDPVPLSILVRRFERPPAVRLEPGVTVAVVGPGDLALRTASQMAGRAGLDARDVLLAGEIDSVAGHGRRLLTVAAAARHRSRRQPDVTTFVALGVGGTVAGWVEAGQLLAALAPEQAWGVVDARLRVSEVRRWVRTVGARHALDALAVVGTAEAQSPGVVLDAGTPVGWVDGLPATPLVWAALLSERLAEDADWD